MALKDCSREKAPGPDGFNSRFIKKFWKVLKNEMMLLFEQFFRYVPLARGFNSSFIVLIPKKECSADLSEHRPISLLNCGYKILAKVYRLKKVIDSHLANKKSN